MTSLGSLPDEVLLLIFEEILDLSRIEDVKYLLRLQLTCRALFHFINRCPQLQVGLYFQARHGLSTVTTFKQYRGFSPLLVHHFTALLQPGIAAPEAQQNPGLRQFCPFYACYWASTAASRAKFLHRKASWRRLLLTNDKVIETLEIYRCFKTARDGAVQTVEIARVNLRDTISQQSDYFAGGLTMGLLYDLLAGGLLSLPGLPPVDDWGIHIHQKAVEGQTFTVFSERQPPMEPSIGSAVLAVRGYARHSLIDGRDCFKFVEKYSGWWQPAALDSLPMWEWKSFRYSNRELKD